jgi:hypothetical protein
MNTIVIENVDNKTTELLIELIKKLGLRVTTKKEKTSQSKTIMNVKNGFEEMKLINEGKLKSTPIDDFLNEL